MAWILLLLATVACDSMGGAVDGDLEVLDADLDADQDRDADLEVLDCGETCGGGSVCVAEDIGATACRGRYEAVACEARGECSCWRRTICELHWRCEAGECVYP
jgi:hypothetical protein